MSDKKQKSGSGSLLELVLIVATALGLALGIQAFLVKPYRIPSESMEPTLNIGQRVLVNRIGNRFEDPKIGEILVFHPPKGAEQSQCASPNEGQGNPKPCDHETSQRSDQNFIKRVVGVPGDRIAIRDGHVIRNGRAVKESFIRECGGGGDCNFPQAITVPPKHYFMMGDNRGASDDSRFWGPVPKKWIIGGAFATYWPPNRIGLL
ncbi:MAG TPA: signal peptidase I [Solirubrobacteraceae bacterium]